MNIYFDLDGTLLNTFERHTKAHRKAAEICGGQGLEADHYWACKRQGISEDHIAQLCGLGESIPEYQAARKGFLETGDLLNLDRPTEGALEVLAQLKDRGHRLVLATLRRNLAGLKDQLARTGLAPFLDKTLARGDQRGGWDLKRDMIKADQKKNPAEGFMIGDSEGDILAAGGCGIPIYAYSDGSRSPARLSCYRPDGLMDSLKELTTIFT